MENTTILVKEWYFWSNINKYVRKFFECCRVCPLAKGRSQNTRLYTPFLVTKTLWEYVSMDFILEIPLTQRKHDYLMAAVDQFLKMAHFVAFNKKIDASEVDALFFREVVNLHGLLRSITSYIDIIFLGHFLRKLWKNLGSKLLYSSTYHPKHMGRLRW
jgi:hypothetical protein